MSVHDGTDRHDRLNRRAALTKVAAGGAVAWSAPTILSSRALAVDVSACTARCAPFDTTGVTVSISVEIEPCTPGSPGQEPVFGTITQTASSGAPCPCSPSIIRIVSPQPGVVEQLSPGPGNWDGTIPIVAVIECVGEDGELIVRTCGALGDIGASGNCSALGGQTYIDDTILLNCNPPRCS